MSGAIMPVGNVLERYFKSPRSCQRRFREEAIALVLAEDAGWQEQQRRAWDLANKIEDWHAGGSLTVIKGGE